MPAFISIQRFQSLTDPAKLLSLSFWEDEASVSRWRNLEEHRAAQAKGRGSLFRDYRIRVRESWIFRWMGGLGTSVMSDFRKGAESGLFDLLEAHQGLLFDGAVDT